MQQRMEYDGFAKVIRENHSQEHPFRLVEQYIATCEASLQSIINNNLTESVWSKSNAEETIFHLQQEINTWKLIEKLIIVKHKLKNSKNIKIKDAPFPTDFEIYTNIMETDEHCNRLSAIKQWLEETAPPVSPMEIHKGYMYYTKQAKDIRPDDESTVRFLDFDCNIREKRQLLSEDEDLDYKVMKSMFDQLRRGKTGNAYNIALECDNGWRVSSLQGATLIGWFSVDSAFVLHGNSNRELYKKCCEELCKDTSLNLYERAIYALMCGNLENLLPVCFTWEDKMWAYISVLLDSVIDQHIKNNNYRLTKTSDSVLAQNPPLISIEKALENMFSSRSGVADTAAQPFHVVQALLLLDNWKGACESLQAHYLNRSLRRFDFLRFAVHFMWLLQHQLIVVDVGGMNFLLYQYVECLTEIRKHNLAPTYASLLPASNGIESLILFLKKYDRKISKRRHFMDLVKEAGMDSAKLARKLTRSIIISEKLSSENSKVGKIYGISDRLYESEEILVRSLEWLTFDVENLFHLFVEANEIIRSFYLQGRPNAVKALVASLPEEIMKTGLVVDETKLEYIISSEYIQHIHLSECLKSFEAWSKYKETHHYLFSTTSTHSILSENPELSMDEILQQRQEAKLQTIELERLLRDFLKFDILSMEVEYECHDPEIKASIDNKHWERELQTIRNMYVPLTVFKLYEVLYASMDLIEGNLRKSFEIVSLVANNWNGLLDTFMNSVESQPRPVSMLLEDDDEIVFGEPQPSVTCPLLKRLLGLVNQSALKMLQRKEDIFGGKLNVDTV